MVDTIYNTPQMLKQAKSRSYQKTKSNIPSPRSTLTTVSLLLGSLMVSPSSAVATRTTRSRYDCTIKSISFLTMQSVITHIEGVGEVNIVVNTTPIDLKQVSHVHCTYINQHNIPASLERKRDNDDST